MITIIIASSNEKDSIGRAIRAVIDGYSGEYELIQVSPDEGTLEAGLNMSRELGLGSQYSQIKDPKRGKSYALNLALEKASGSIIVMTDGDVFFNKGALNNLLHCFSDITIGGVCGRPISLNDRATFWGYISHLLTDAADKRRKEIFNENRSNYYTKKDAYFPMSGYILAFRNIGIMYDSQYIDDALISLKVLEEGYQLAYTPNAEVQVKFPTNLKDYLLQRKRNFKGNKEIHLDERFKGHKDPRSFVNELRYFLYPLRYARSLRELYWSLLLYPLRLYTWIVSLGSKSNQKEKSWDSVTSTK